jgi:hypothetical protein
LKQTKILIFEEHGLAIKKREDFNAFQAKSNFKKHPKMEEKALLNIPKTL